MVQVAGWQRLQLIDGKGVSCKHNVKGACDAPTVSSRLAKRPNDANRCLIERQPLHELLENVTLKWLEFVDRPALHERRPRRIYDERPPDRDQVKFASFHTVKQVVNPGHVRRVGASG